MLIYMDDHSLQLDKEKGMNPKHVWKINEQAEL